MKNNNPAAAILKLARLSGITAVPRAAGAPRPIPPPAVSPAAPRPAPAAKRAIARPAAPAAAPAIPPPAARPAIQPHGPWAALAISVNACTKCAIAATKQNYVFGEGALTARIMFVGEAPGGDEDRQGRPFVGRAGQLLSDIIAKGMGLEREDVYIANCLKCRPPENRPPHPDELANCLPFLRAQIELIKPAVIVALGAHAAHTLLATQTPISTLRGRFHYYQGIPLMPTFHPVDLLRNSGAKKEVWEDIKAVLRKAGLPIPGR
ncbi:MAG: uracil-DNA glycosylase [Planctomycetota bacterium]